MIIGYDYVKNCIATKYIDDINSGKSSVLDTEFLKRLITENILLTRLYMQKISDNTDLGYR